jgi:uncharacterized Zn finger protein (UPF0148 family)
MTDETCPNCGATVPRETGQHALTPSAGVVACPSCGATLTLDRAGAEPAEGAAGEGPRAQEGGWGQATGEDSFAGQETVEDVKDELRDKEGGPT